jgi:hypothetical protein
MSVHRFGVRYLPSSALLTDLWSQQALSRRAFPTLESWLYEFIVGWNVLPILQQFLLLNPFYLQAVHVHLADGVNKKKMKRSAQQHTSKSNRSKA